MRPMGVLVDIVDGNSHYRYTNDLNLQMELGAELVDQVHHIRSEVKRLKRTHPQDKGRIAAGELLEDILEATYQNFASRFGAAPGASEKETRRQRPGRSKEEKRQKRQQLREASRELRRKGIRVLHFPE